MNFYKHVSMFALVGLSVSLAANEYCPTLTSANLVEAACSTQTKLFKTKPASETDPTSKFGFYAEPVCNWSFWARKKAQALKSDKPYEGRLFSHPDKAPEQEDGQVICTYKLPNLEWRDYAYVKGKWILDISIAINSIELADYWSTELSCPKLAAADIYSLAENGKTEVFTDKNLKLTLTTTEPIDFKATRNHRPPRDSLSGEKRVVKQQFMVECEYTLKDDTFRLKSKWE